MDIIEKALKVAEENNFKILRVHNIGYDDTFEIVTMVTPESEESGDGFDALLFGVNKKTKQEAFNSPIGITSEPGFETLNFGKLTYKDV